MNTVLLAAQFTNYCATYMVFNMVNDFASQMNSIVIKANEVLDSYKGTDSGAVQDDCGIELVYASKTHIDSLRAELEALAFALRDDYKKAIDATVSQMIAISTFKDTEREYKATLNAKVFGENNGSNQNKRTH